MFHIPPGTSQGLLSLVILLFFVFFFMLTLVAHFSMSSVCLPFFDNSKNLFFIICNKKWIVGISSLKTVIDAISLCSAFNRKQMRNRNSHFQIIPYSLEVHLYCWIRFIMFLCKFSGVLLSIWYSFSNVRHSESAVFQNTARQIFHNRHF